jgi:hypothetical protein
MKQDLFIKLKDIYASQKYKFGYRYSRGFGFVINRNALTINGVMGLLLSTEAA